MHSHPVLAAALLWCIPLPAAAQVTDTLLVWRTYAQEASARLHVYESGDESRPLTAVLDERAASTAGPATDDARFLAETVGRLLGHDPAEMTFIFRFTPASFCEGGSDRGKQLLVRATFHRTRTGALASPNWRIITRDELARLTDRALY